MAEYRLASSVSESWFLCMLAHRHIVIVYWDSWINRAIIKVISNPFVFSTMTSQNVCIKNTYLCEMNSWTVLPLTNYQAVRSKEDSTKRNHEKLDYYHVEAKMNLRSLQSVIILQRNHSSHIYWHSHVHIVGICPKWTTNTKLLF